MMSRRRGNRVGFVGGRCFVDYFEGDFFDLGIGRVVFRSLDGFRFGGSSEKF